MEETRKVALSRFRRVMVSVLTIEPNVRGLRPLRGDGFLWVIKSSARLPS
jgi:hypothetical protein